VSDSGDTVLTCPFLEAAVRIELTYRALQALA
jgi:hypothetical protein